MEVGNNEHIQNCGSCAMIGIHPNIVCKEWNRLWASCYCYECRYTHLLLHRCKVFQMGIKIQGTDNNHALPVAVPFQACPPNTKKASHLRNLLFTETGNVLLSQAASRQVSSALESLTSVFEMGTGVSSPLLSPDSLLAFFNPDFAAALSLISYVL